MHGGEARSYLQGAEQEVQIGDAVEDLLLERRSLRTCA